MRETSATIGASRASCLRIRPREAARNLHRARRGHDGRGRGRPTRPPNIRRTRRLIPSLLYCQCPKRAPRASTVTKHGLLAATQTQKRIWYRPSTVRFLGEGCSACFRIYNHQKFDSMTNVRQSNLVETHLNVALMARPCVK